jgi:N-ethylmaleimide reductase
MNNSIFSPYQLGNIELKNRVVMAPMTRSRSTGNVPGELVATYYEQRSEAGLIVTEGTSPSPNGLGYPRIPGLFSLDHVTGWSRVTEAVHRGGSRIFVQLMHTGRIGHPLNLPSRGRVLAPSAIAAPDTMFTDEQGPQPLPQPEAMTEVDIRDAVGEFARAAELARDAGFDGVELHSANGYLLDQFLNVASNQRTDQWGGSVEGRIRFVVTVASAVADRIGADRVGIRLSPYGVFNGMTPDDDHDKLYETLTERLSVLGLTYVHIVDHSAMGAPQVKEEIKATIRQRFDGSYILSGGYDLKRAEADLQAKRGDLVAFGRPFISNPRLVSRLQNGRELIPPDFDTFYSPGDKGYTDYPLEA